MEHFSKSSGTRTTASLEEFVRDSASSNAWNSASSTAAGSSNGGFGYGSGRGASGYGAIDSHYSSYSSRASADGSDGYGRARRSSAAGASSGGSGVKRPISSSSQTVGMDPHQKRARASWQGGSGGNTGGALRPRPPSVPPPHVRRSAGASKTASQPSAPWRQQDRISRPSSTTRARPAGDGDNARGASAKPGSSSSAAPLPKRMPLRRVGAVRRPPALPAGDTRFTEVDQRRRVCVCDACGRKSRFTGVVGKFQGNFLSDASRHVAFALRLGMWARGEIDGRWWCVVCLAGRLAGDQAHAVHDAIVERSVRRRVKHGAYRKRRKEKRRKALAQKDPEPQGLPT